MAASAQAVAQNLAGAVTTFTPIVPWPEFGVWIGRIDQELPGFRRYLRQPFQLRGFAARGQTSFCGRRWHSGFRIRALRAYGVFAFQQLMQLSTERPGFYVDPPPLPDRPRPYIQNARPTMA